MTHFFAMTDARNIESREGICGLLKKHFDLVQDAIMSIIID